MPFNNKFSLNFPKISQIIILDKELVNPIRGGRLLNLFGAGGGSDLTPQPNLTNFHPNMDFLGQNHSKFNFQQLLFSWHFFDFEKNADF